MIGESAILPDEEVRRLNDEYARLSEQHRKIGARLDEINRAIVASGEAKVRAMKDMQADLEQC